MSDSSDGGERRVVGARLADYFVAVDGDNEPTLWAGSRDDLHPRPVCTAHAFRNDPAVWALIVTATETALARCKRDHPDHWGIHYGNACDGCWYAEPETSRHTR